MNDESNPNDIEHRPSDDDLRELAEGWRELVNRHGPYTQIPMLALALVTLTEELLELRKMPRA